MNSHEYPPPSPRSYHDPDQYQADLESVFARTWQWLGDDRDLRAASSWWPTTLLPDSLDEPLVLTRSQGQLRGFANVCTHRAALLTDSAGTGRVLRCPYHGRCFSLDGQYKSALGFGPGEPDLHPVPVQSWGPHLWGCAQRDILFSPVAELLEPLAFADWRGMVHRPQDDVDYEFDAPWATYVENYLEGLHIPFVHPGLVQSLDLEAYRVLTHPAGVLQVGVATPGQTTLKLPKTHRFYGQELAALYAWVFPNTILNLYPWGASINLIQPLGPSRTRVRYLTYVGDAGLRGAGAGADVHQTEAEDQAVVRRVSRGLKSRWARPASYAPGHEDGVAWFHQLLAEARLKARPTPSQTE